MTEVFDFFRQFLRRTGAYLGATDFFEQSSFYRIYRQLCKNNNGSGDKLRPRSHMLERWIAAVLVTVVESTLYQKVMAFFLSLYYVFVGVFAALNFNDMLMRQFILMQRAYPGVLSSVFRQGLWETVNSCSLGGLLSIFDKLLTVGFLSQRMPFLATYLQPCFATMAHVNPILLSLVTLCMCAAYVPEVCVELPMQTKTPNLHGKEELPWSTTDHPLLTLFFYSLYAGFALYFGSRAILNANHIMVSDQVYKLMSYGSLSPQLLSYYHQGFSTAVFGLVMLLFSNLVRYYGRYIHPVSADLCPKNPEKKVSDGKNESWLFRHYMPYGTRVFLCIAAGGGLYALGDYIRMGSSSLVAMRELSGGSIGFTTATTVAAVLAMAHGGISWLKKLLVWGVTHLSYNKRFAGDAEDLNRHNWFLRWRIFQSNDWANTISPIRHFFTAVLVSLETFRGGNGWVAVVLCPFFNMFNECYKNYLQSMYNRHSLKSMVTSGAMVHRRLNAVELSFWRCRGRLYGLNNKATTGSEKDQYSHIDPNYKRDAASEPINGDSQSKVFYESMSLTEIVLTSSVRASIWTAHKAGRCCGMTR